MPRTLTYEQLLDQVKRAADSWRAAGILATDGIAILLPHIEESVIAFFAAMSVGVAFPVNPLLAAVALGPQLDLAQVKSAVIPAMDWPGDTRTRFLDALKYRPSISNIINVERDIKGAGKASTWEEFLLRGTSAFEEHRDIYRAAAVFHTGGTTGAPKLAELSARNVSAGAIMSAFGWKWRPEDRVVVGLPLFHVGGVITTLLSTLAAGATAILPSALGARDPELVREIWQFIDKAAATVLLMVPTSLSAIAEVPLGDASLVNLRAVATGAAPLPSELSHKIERMTQVPVCQGYGMTELAGVGALQPCDGTHRAQAVGFPVPMIDMRIASSVPLSQRGELSWHGPNTFLGYRTPTGLLDSPVRGWVHSGDIGELLPDGQLQLRGRLKEVIIRSGHNIDPIAIEEAAASHPDVRQSAAVPMPDEYAGELPALYVSVRTGSTVTENELLKYIAARIFEPPARPQFIFIVSEIPLTPSGKYSRFRLRQQAVEWRVRQLLGPDSDIIVICEDVAAKSVRIEWPPSADVNARANLIDSLARLGLSVSS